MRSGCPSAGRPGLHTRQPINHRAQSPLVVGPASRLSFLPSYSRTAPGDFAPMDANALKRYWIFRAFGNVRHRAGYKKRGAREFLGTSCSFSLEPRTALWITAQGRFADAQERPPAIQSGVAHLAVASACGHFAAGSGISLLERHRPEASRN